jgi:sugar/nucleoside kinase (ribokinase family)
MELLIAGSIAYDTIESEAGRSDESLGGSATYAGISARFHLDTARIGLLGVVGQDFRREDWDLLASRPLDLSGVSRLQGETFRWHGRYQSEGDDAITISTDLNVLMDFVADVPEKFLQTEIFLCANLHPRLQEDLLVQINSKLLIVDTMNKWIDEEREQLCRVLSAANITVLNSTELAMLTGHSSVEEGAESLLAGECLEGLEGLEGPDIVVVKLAAKGAVAFGPWGVIHCSGREADVVIDPTGCGDVFAGAMAAHLLSEGIDGLPELEQMRVALEHANRTASFNVESFGITAIAELSADAYQQRT